MEDPKNTKDDKKEKESPELKEELTEDELKGVDGGESLGEKGADKSWGFIPPRKSPPYPPPM